jgi:UDPglucose 6-dehydrogenase
MKISVFGTGYVGLIVGLCLADFGNEVICLDVDEQKIEKLNQGICPIYEPGAEVLLTRNIKAGRLHFATKAKEALESAEIVFVAVGTPEDKSGNADLQYVYQAAEEIASYIDEYTIIVNKSTVPVGTAKKVEQIIANTLQQRGKSVPFDVASNPEFLREGKAVGDFLNPDRIILGVSSERAGEKLKKIYQLFERSNKPIVITDTETAEMIKYASNAFLATKITFINEMANLCEKVGADVLEVARMMGKDGRISPKFLHPGPGYGGSCFPKDTKAIAATARQNGVPLTLVESVISANERQKQIAAKKIADRFPDGGVIAFLGLAFKPETDDVREAPALVMIRALAQNPAYRFRLYDPQAMEQAQKELADLEDRIIWCHDAYQASEKADCVAVITEWFEFRNLNFDRMKDLLNQFIIFDFRNIYDVAALRQAGCEIHQIGVS